MLNPRVVPRCQRIKAPAFGKIQKAGEFNVFVAQNIRIRRSSLLIFLQEVGKHMIPILFDKIDAQKLYPQTVSDTFGIHPVLFLGTDIGIGIGIA